MRNHGTRLFSGPRDDLIFTGTIFTGTIFTGTPAGVGPVKPGDRLEGAIAGLGTLHITIGAKEV